MTGGKVKRAAAACCAAIAGLGADASAAQSAPALVAVSTSQVSLSPATGGGLSGTISVFSLRQPTVTLTARAVGQGCTPRLGGASDAQKTPAPIAIRAAQQQSVTVTFPASCANAKKTEVTAKTTFQLVATEVGGQTAKPIVMSVTIPTTPDWDDLLGFAAGLLGGALLAVLAYCKWKHIRYGARWRADHVSVLLKPMKGLSTSWSFSGSWASSVTTGSGLLVAIVGSATFLNAVLSANATNALAIATVAGLIGPAVVAAAGVCTAAIKKPTDTTADVTALGFLLGSALALGAAGGQVAVVTLAVLQAGLGTWSDILLIIGGVLAEALLVGYGWTSVVSTLILGFGGRRARTRTHTKDKVAAAAWKLTDAAAEGTVSHDAIARIVREQFGTEELPAGADPAELERRTALP